MRITIDRDIRTGRPRILFDDLIDGRHLGIAIPLHPKAFGSWEAEFRKLGFEERDGIVVWQDSGHEAKFAELAKTPAEPEPEEDPES